MLDPLVVMCGSLVDEYLLVSALSVHSLLEMVDCDIVESVAAWDLWD